MVHALLIRFTRRRWTSVVVRLFILTSVYREEINCIRLYKYFFLFEYLDTFKLLPQPISLENCQTPVLVLRVGVDFVLPLSQEEEPSPKSIRGGCIRRLIFNI